MDHYPCCHLIRIKKGKFSIQHIVTLSFDDGFLKSNLKIAEIYERYNLSACFNVIATGADDSFVSPDSGQGNIPKGNFELWNDLQSRGHEIMPHGFKHANKSKIPFEEAQTLIIDCLDIFQAKLDGFDPRHSIFNFPYNQSTPELEVWLPSVLAAYRRSGGGLNQLPYPGMTKLTTTGFGPENCEAHLDQEIEQLLSAPSGWLIYNTHGLDNEGWGPIGTSYLDELLYRLTAIETVSILPAGKALGVCK
ncbi:MAG: polysaccharide deacetylase family protein [Lentisphaeria bacterium]|nr:polysaccharide deacetylase family protein [Lentisphaeria bacterium]NQZ66900.1 polysaccharide deacetylase family protein [Lentisphaeria bacterium]